MLPNSLRPKSLAPWAESSNVKLCAPPGRVSRRRTAQTGRRRAGTVPSSRRLAWRAPWSWDRAPRCTAASAVSESAPGRSSACTYPAWSCSVSKLVLKSDMLGDGGKSEVEAMRRGEEGKNRRRGSRRRGSRRRGSSRGGRTSSRGRRRVGSSSSSSSGRARDSRALAPWRLQVAIALSHAPVAQTPVSHGPCHTERHCARLGAGWRVQEASEAEGGVVGQ